VADEPVVLLVGDVDQPGQPAVDVAMPIGRMKVARAVVRQRDRQPGVPACLDEALGLLEVGEARG